jgi:hypothetical protein
MSWSDDPVIYWTIIPGEVPKTFVGFPSSLAHLLVLAILPYPEEDLVRRFIHYRFFHVMLLAKR